MQIQLVPNSGHHFYWSPFDVEVLRRLSAATRESLEKECQRNSAWVPATDNDGRPMHWVRFKYSMGYEGANRVLGVNLALDSNLGDVTRGSTLVPAEAVPTFDFTGQPKSPYAFRAETEIAESGHTKIAFGWPNEEKSEVLAEVQIEWTVQMAQSAIPVDLIVDFGNTRTVAILLEQTPAQIGSPGEALRQMVRPVRFMKRDQSFSEEQEGQTIVDSWFVLHEPQFQEFEPPQAPEDAAMQEFVVETEQRRSFFRKPAAGKKIVTHVIRRVPQMFVEFSPLALGVEARPALRKLEFSGGGISFLSSPKRYAWDNRISAQAPGQNQLFWAMVRNDWNPAYKDAQNAPLACQVLRFFPHDGSDWELESPPTEFDAARRPSARPISPIYPRADALAWMALAVIEAAYRQMNAPEYWKDNYPYVRRVLRSVQVTHPSGWTTAELNAYKSKWQKAVNAFVLGHLDRQNQTPALEFPIDEAIASQLPLIFAEIQHMHGVGENWVELMGWPDSKGVPTVRAMTIDVGGGTTDYAIVEYQDKMKGAGVELTANLLFKDTTNIAGDEIVKGLIEGILLPKLGHRFANVEEASDLYASFFRQGFRTQREKEIWKRITRLVFVPIVTRWLHNLCEGRKLGSETFGYDLVDSDAVKELNGLAREFFGSAGSEMHLPGGKLLNAEGTEQERTNLDVAETEIAEVITDKLLSTIRSLSKFVSVFDVDLVIVTGKPSELPTVQQMMTDCLPITKDRVLCAKGFYAGDWYPFNTAGKINDAKTVTAIGLALYKAIVNGSVPGWSMQDTAAQTSALRFYWVGIPAFTHEQPSIYLTPQQDSTTVELMNNSRIGRRLLPSSRDPEPTYLFRWVNSSKAPPSRMLVTLERVRDDNEQTQGISETLRIKNISTSGTNQPIDLADVSLDICTLSSDEYWLDNPRFKVAWPE